MQEKTIKASVKQIQPMLVERFKMEELTEEDRNVVIHHMTEAVVQRVMVESYDTLENESDKNDFSKLMDKNNPPAPEQVDDFLNQKLGEKYQSIIIGAIDDLEKNVNEVEN